MTTAAPHVDDAPLGLGYDEDPRFWDYGIYLAPATGTGAMPVTCGGNPSNAAARVGPGGGRFGPARTAQSVAETSSPHPQAACTSAYRSVPCWPHSPLTTRAVGPATRAWWSS